MGTYIRNHFITDELDVDVSTEGQELPEDYRYGFRVETGGDVVFVYEKSYKPEGPNTFRTRTLADGEEFFGKVAFIRAAAQGTTATGITAFSAQP